MAERILKNGGINWTWYCHVIINKDDTVTVTKEYRLHDFDHWQGAGQHPKADGNYRVLEERIKNNDTGWDTRIAVGISIDGKEYKLDKSCERFDLGK